MHPSSCLPSGSFPTPQHPRFMVNDHRPFSIPFRAISGTEPRIDAACRLPSATDADAAVMTPLGPATPRVTGTAMTPFFISVPRRIAAIAPAVVSAPDIVMPLGAFYAAMSPISPLRACSCRDPESARNHCGGHGYFQQFHPGLLGKEKLRRWRFAPPPGNLVGTNDAPTCCPVTLFLESARPVYRRCTMPEDESSCA